MLAFGFLSETGPDGSLVWLLWWVLGFFLLMIVVGWLVSRGNESRLDVRNQVQDHPQVDVEEPVKAGIKSPKLKGKRRK